mmetsp:Transcript_32563/g.52762  ORF Transcript_32563/g.52762 Transcript_32563/m.52762 type:complete len:110 (+) Transcript_32563:2003-2332(+)
MTTIWTFMATTWQHLATRLSARWRGLITGQSILFFSAGACSNTGERTRWAYTGVTHFTALVLSTSKRSITDLCTLEVSVTAGTLLSGQTTSALQGGDTLAWHAITSMTS